MHLSGPFPVVGPIKDGTMGRDGGGCLVVRHYEKTKLVSYWSNYKVGGLWYCRNIVLSAYYVAIKHQGAPMVVPDYQTPDWTHEVYLSPMLPEGHFILLH